MENKSSGQNRMSISCKGRTNLKGCSAEEEEEEGGDGDDDNNDDFHPLPPHVPSYFTQLSLT